MDTSNASVGPRRRFATLGPSGTCHDEALHAYLDFQGIVDAEVIYIEDFVLAVDAIANGDLHFALQGCAHPDVAKSIERQYQSVAVLDTFLYPTKSLALLHRKGRPRKTLGLMPVTMHYLDLSEWEVMQPELSNAVVARNFLQGDYDGAITFTSVAHHDASIEVLSVIGNVQMAWHLFGVASLRQEGLIAVPRPNLFDP